MFQIKKIGLKTAITLISRKYSSVLAAGNSRNQAALPREEKKKQGRYLKKGLDRLIFLIRLYNQKLKEKQLLEQSRSPFAVVIGGAGGAGGVAGMAGVSGKKSGTLELEGAKIDISHLEKSYVSKTYSDEELKHFNMEYNLSPLSPRSTERIFAWAGIKWSDESDSLIYYINEEPLAEEDMQQIKRIKQVIEEKIDISFDALQTASAISYLKKAIDEIIVQFGIFVPPERRELYEYYILRDFIGYGKLQPLMNDPNLEDISCDGVNIPLFVYHRNPVIGSIKTNVVFTTKEELDDFVMRLSQKCGRSISVSEPLSEGALPDGSRLHATLGTDIARRGSNFTIRKFTTDPLTPMHLLASGTLNEKMLAYCWYAIENNASILISGPTASGKTSLLNALSLFIKPVLKIVTIEDTPELKLPHTHWVPEVSRQGMIGLGGKVIGEVSMFDLLKGSLRQRPDYIIVGEVRGEEAYVLFQQMASGHPGLSTIHADSVDKVVDRLTTPPINLPPMLLETLDLIIFIKHIRFRGRYVRRVMEVQEIDGYDTKEKELKSLRVFRWSPRMDVFETDASSALLRKIAQDTGVNEEQVKAEVNKRIRIISWLKERNIINYRDVGRVITAFYTNPEELLEKIEEEEMEKK
ncbi:Type II/IV secretion system protein [uncultured archaeon]|nr:Type II/IV secretion system protein [uncultured archaeon]